MNNNRDDFTKATIDILGKRSSYLCSNPNCRKFTIGAHEKNDKSTTIGIAAHITAASPNGPRFDATITPEMRRHIDNGIWLCSNCASLIDKDENLYTIQLLKQWKEQSENESRKRLNGEIRNSSICRPYLEVDLIWKSGGRSNRGYSNKNPIEIHNGMKVFNIDNHPIIYWGLVWNFDFVIYNNSNFPAFNVQIESIGSEHFTNIDQLSKINNLPPYKNIDLKAKFEDFYEGIAYDAEIILREKMPEKFKDLKFKLTFYDENRQIYTNFIEIIGDEIINKTE